MKEVVAHSLRCYLALTAKWFYEHLINMKEHRHIVVASVRDNTELFPFTEIFIAEDLPKIKRLLFDALEKFSGVNDYFKYQVLKTNKADLLHSHFGNTGWEDISLARKLKIPHVVSFYGFDLALLPKTNPEWVERYKDLFNSAQIFIVEGNKMKESLIQAGCREEKIHINHLGVDLKINEFLARKIGKSGKIKLLIVSRFTEKKGIPIAIAAFGRLSSKYANMELTIIGDSSGSQGQEMEKRKILNLVKEYGVSDRVNFLGFQPISTIRKIAKEHHIFLSPSLTSRSGDNEGGIPEIVIEFSATGMPILSTKHCDIPEAVIDGVTGLLAEENNIDDLTEKLEWLIAHPEKWEDFGRAGRKHIEENYDIVKTSRGLEEIYSQALSSQ